MPSYCRVSWQTKSPNTEMVQIKGNILQCMSLTTVFFVANLSGLIANSLKIEHYLLVLSFHYFWKPPSTKICSVSLL